MLHCTKDRKYFAKMKELDIDLKTAAQTLAFENKESQEEPALLDKYSSNLVTQESELTRSYSKQSNGCITSNSNALPSNIARI